MSFCGKRFAGVEFSMDARVKPAHDGAEETC
jgi:hypothetical protein